MSKTVAIVSANGGIGKSVFTCALAFACAGNDVNTALADLCFYKSGLAVLLGLENKKGLRWSELNSAVGDISRQNLVENLIGYKGTRILSVDYRNPAPNEIDVVYSVLKEIKSSAECVFIDLDVMYLESKVYDEIDDFVLLVRPTVQGVAGAKGILDTHKNAKAYDEKSFKRWHVAVSNLEYKKDVKVYSNVSIERILGVKVSAVINPEKQVCRSIETGLGIDLHRAKKLSFACLDMLREVIG